MLNAILLISAGASSGATLRWLLGLSLNALFPSIPPGTLIANLLGGYLVGIALVLFANNPGIAPEWRLLFVTGFLGALTTFSTFSAEIATLVQQQRLITAISAIALHVLGSLAMTFLGMATVALIKP